MENRKEILTCNKVLKDGVRPFLKYASEDHYMVLNDLVRKHHPETEDCVQIFNISEDCDDFIPVGSSTSYVPGVIPSNKSIKLRHVRMSIRVPPVEPGFDTSIVIGVLVDDNMANRTVARISFDENTIHYKEIPYEELIVD